MNTSEILKAMKKAKVSFQDLAEKMELPVGFLEDYIKNKLGFRGCLLTWEEHETLAELIGRPCDFGSPEFEFLFGC